MILLRRWLVRSLTRIHSSTAFLYLVQPQQIINNHLAQTTIRINILLVHNHEHALIGVHRLVLARIVRTGILPVTRVTRLPVLVVLLIRVSVGVSVVVTGIGLLVVSGLVSTMVSILIGLTLVGSYRFVLSLVEGWIGILLRVVSGKFYFFEELFDFSV
jgi:hypothetical protein